MDKVAGYPAPAGAGKERALLERALGHVFLSCRGVGEVVSCREALPVVGRTHLILHGETRPKRSKFKSQIAVVFKIHANPFSYKL